MPAARGSASDHARVWWGAFREFLYGVTGYEFSRHAVQMRAEMETVFMLVTMGDLIGVPVMPPYYSLRLVPYAVPLVAAWKRRALRMRDFWDKEEYDLLEL